MEPEAKLPMHEKAELRRRKDALLTSPNARAWLASNDAKKPASRPPPRREKPEMLTRARETPEAYQQRLDGPWPIIKSDQVTTP